MYFYIIVGAIVLVLIIYFIITYNAFISLNNDVNESFATMDVFLKKRWDLIPNFVEVIKSYSKYEKNTLKEIVELRNSAYDQMSLDNKIENNEKLTKSLNKFFALAEAYPDLKANQNYLDLSNQLVVIEQDIAEARKYYNAVVRNYNNKVQKVPSNLVAKIFNFKLKKMFEVSKNERENIKVEL